MIVEAATLRRPRLALALLSLGQVASWGVLYYALIVAGPKIAEQTGWALELVTLLFSAGLIVAALAGIATGRLLDRRGPRLAMTTGSVVAVVGFVIVALAPSPLVFGLGWVVVGVAQSAVLYQAAFTVLTRRYRDRRRGPMTVLTLAGGLASTVFAPVVAGLLSVTDWRTTFLVLAAVLAVVTIPIHAFSLERDWSAEPPHPESEHPAEVSAVLRTARFWWLEASFVLLAVGVYSATLAAVPLLMEKGLDFELAAIGLGLLGAGQVAGRLLYLALPHRTAPWIPLFVVCLASAVLLVTLALVPGTVWLVIVLGMLAGAVRGAETLVQASAVSDRWGTRNYGAINGAFAAPVTIVSALAPAIGALVASVSGGYSVMVLIMAGVVALAAIAAPRS